MTITGAAASEVIRTASLVLRSNQRATKLVRGNDWTVPEDLMTVKERNVAPGSSAFSPFSDTRKPNLVGGLIGYL